MSPSIPLSDLESSPSAKFAKIGDGHAGTITDLTERQQTDLSKRPLTFEDGTPRMMWVITLQTKAGDRVALWAKGGKFRPASGTGESMLAAIGTAVREAGAEAVDIGGELAIVHTGLGEAKTGQDPPKLYTAQYRPPKGPTISAADLFGDSPSGT
jgi:hypothetical protein